MMRSKFAVYAVVGALSVLPLCVYAQKERPVQSTEVVPLIRVEEKDAPNIDFDWQLRPRTPIKFTPFEMLDPNTGKPVKADDIIEVNGVKMKAGDFYRQLNEMERWLNAQGYSLRTDTVFEYYSPQLEMELADSERRLRELEAQMPLSGEPIDESDTFSPAACSSGGRSFDTGWYGNSLFGIRLVGQGTYQACFPPASASVQGNARLDGRLAGFERTVASATASASGSTSDFQNLSYQYGVNVQVLGNTVWGPSGSGTVPLSYSNNWDWQIAAIDWRSPTIPLGCVNIFGINICLNGRVGVSGSLRLAAGVNLNLLSQTANARPYGYLGGFAEAWIGVNAGIARAEAGVRGNITFVNGSIEGTANGNISFSFDWTRGFQAYYNYNTRLYANLSALSGSINPYARGCIWFFGWRCAEASFTLFSWSGFSWSRRIGNWGGSFRIY